MLYNDYNDVPALQENITGINKGIVWMVLESKNWGEKKNQKSEFWYSVFLRT